MRHRAYVGIGSNLGDREHSIHDAAVAIRRLPGTAAFTESSIYVSAPVGASDEQPDYYNAAVGFDTALGPEALLAALQQIERDAGRTRVAGQRNTARTLDLDILLFDDMVIATEGLRVPHPRLQDRAFVLLPLVEIAPEVAVPGLGSARGLLPRVTGQRIERLPAAVDSAA